MFNKKTTRNLILVVAVMAGMYFLSEKFSSSAQTRSFRSVVIEMDTTNLKSFTLLQSADTNGVITFSRQEDGWYVGQGDHEFKADDNSVRAFIGNFENLKTARFAGPSETVRQRYDVNDERGQKVVFTMTDGSSQSALIGKVSFANDASGQQTGKVSYLSVNEEEEVYVTNSTLANDALQEFNLWRPRHLWNRGSETWAKVVLREGNNSMTLEKKGDVWVMQDDTVIIDRMNSYMNTIANGRLAHYNNAAIIDGLDPIKQIIIFDSALDGPRSLNVYQLPSGAFVLNSEMNPGCIFDFTMDRDYRKLFRPPSFFIPLEKLKDNPELTGTN